MTSIGCPKITKTRWNWGFLFFGSPSRFTTTWMDSGFFLSSLTEIYLTTYLFSCPLNLEKTQHLSLLNSTEKTLVEVTTLKFNLMFILIFLRISSSSLILFCCSFIISSFFHSILILLFLVLRYSSCSNSTSRRSRIKYLSLLTLSLLFVFYFSRMYGNIFFISLKQKR